MTDFVTIDSANVAPVYMYFDVATSAVTSNYLGFGNKINSASTTSSYVQ
jgi:hypothetical protein